jgi:hypothetical protein
VIFRVEDMNAPEKEIRDQGSEISHDLKRELILRYAILDETWAAKVTDDRLISEH